MQRSVYIIPAIGRMYKYKRFLQHCMTLSSSSSGLVRNQISELLRKSDFLGVVGFIFINTRHLGRNKQAILYTPLTHLTDYLLRRDSKLYHQHPALPRPSTAPNCTYTKLENHHRKPHEHTSGLLPECRPQSRTGRGVSPWGTTKR